MSLIQIFAFPDYAIAVSDGRTSIPLINENGQRIENRFSDIEHENFTKMRIYNKMLFFSTGATRFKYIKDNDNECSYTFIEILEDLNARNDLNHSPSDIMDYLCNNFQSIGSDSQIGILYLNKETNFFEIVFRSSEHESNNPDILKENYCQNFSDNGMPHSHDGHTTSDIT